ncbi:MAG: PAS domain S-box protein [Bacteroidetes bacterium]|nr:PAS domain S-box protein [Bacteroidota bacterium]
MKSLKLKYLIFIGSVVLTIFISQLVIQYDLNEQNSDARLINLAGRQRMLSQRISKLTLFLQYNNLNKRDSSFYRVDTLKKLVDVWEEVHFQLIKQNQLYSKSVEIDSLLRNNTEGLQQVVSSCRQIIRSPDSSTVKQAIANIAKYELPFLLRMEKTVQTYQKEAERKLKFLKQLELILSVIAVIILISEFVFIVIPGSNQLNKANQELIQRNGELVASEEEIRSSLEQIRALQLDLEVKQRQYEGLIDGALDSIYELDHRGNLSFINPLMEKMTGFSKHELLGKHYRGLIYQDDIEQVVAFYKGQLSNKKEDSYLEFRIQTKGGSFTWVGQNVRLFFNERKVYKVSVVARDINQIKESQLALSRERILMRTIVDNIPAHIYAKNLRSEKILANRTEYLYLGGQVESDVLGKSDWDLYPNEIAEISIAEDRLIFDGEAILNRETLNRRKDGSQTWFLTSKLPLRNEHQQIVGLVGISIDISSQIKAKEELERSEKLYRLLAENSQDVISLHKLDGTFEYVSPSSINLHGYYPNELVGRNGLEFVLVDDSQRILATAPWLLERMKNNEPLEPSQFRIVTKNRGIVWVENLIKPLFDRGELSGFQSTVRDISTRKAYEVALEKAKLAAEHATLAKSQFLSMMSHEIRTPMNGIIGITNILLTENPRVDQLDNLKLLKFSCNNLLSIINDILDYSKVEAGKIELENISFNLNDILYHYKKLHEQSAKQKGMLF